MDGNCAMAPSGEDVCSPACDPADPNACPPLDAPALPICHDPEQDSVGICILDCTGLVDACPVGMVCVEVPDNTVFACMWP
jgi:hypothetical protein